MVAFATKAGKIFYLEHCRKTQNLNVVEESKERLWHRRYGHIGENSLRNLANHNLAENSISVTLEKFIELHWWEAAPDSF